MSKNVLLHRSLESSLPFVLAFLRGKSAQPIFFEGWTELTRHLHDPQTVAMVIPLSVGEFNGAACARQVKARGAFREIRVYLLATSDVGSAREEAETSGCDLLAAGEGAEVSILRALEEDVFPKMEPSPRTSARFALSGQIIYILGDQAEIGEILNASRTGLLFASTRFTPQGSRITVRLQSEEKIHYDVPAEITRTISLGPAYGNFRYGLGVRFIDLTPEAESALDWLLAYRATHVPVWSYEAILRILKADPTVVAGMLREETTRAFVDAFTGALRPFEREALVSDSYGSLLIRSLVTTRLQCSVLHTFLPQIRKNERDLAAAFVPLLRLLLDRVRKLEVDSEKRIQECRESSGVEEQQNLTEAADRMHAEKLKVLFAADETLSPETLSSEDARFLHEIRDQVATKRQQQRLSKVPV